MLATAGMNGGGIYTPLADHSIVVPETAYGNLNIGEAVIFSGNTAGAGSSLPPDNRITRIATTSASIFGYALNNYDINYRGRLVANPNFAPIAAAFDEFDWFCEDIMVYGEILPETDLMWLDLDALSVDETLPETELTLAGIDMLSTYDCRDGLPCPSGYGLDLDEPVFVPPTGELLWPDLDTGTLWLGENELAWLDAMVYDYVSIDAMGIEPASIQWIITIETTTTYTFDNRNNRATMVVTGDENHTTTYTYDLNNRLLSKTRTEVGSTPQTTTFTYDRNGNQFTQVTDGVQQIHTYDAFNRLVSVTRPATADAAAINATYTHRTDSLRHSKTVNGVTTTHVWDMGNIILERNAGGAVINRFHRGHGHLINSHHHGFYLFNVRGDVVQRTDSQGHVLHSYRFDAFGNQLNADHINTNPFRFAAEYYDWETGFIYLRARYLNTTTGRFLSADPFWGIHNMQGSPAARMQSGNLFAFCYE